MTDPSSTTAKAVTDISPEVTSLARSVDRLPPGTYTITLTKPEYRGQGWDVEISRREVIRTMEIKRGV